MSKQKNFRGDINFLFEMGNIRFIDRMWKRFLRDDFENLAEHHFRVFWIAMTIAMHEKNVDTGKIAKMALMHDITESRTGDVDYLSRQYVERKERLAIDDILMNTALKDEIMALWEEYEERKSLESRIVKDADNLNIDFELAEQAAKGSRIKEVKQPMREVVAETKLYTDTAKQIFQQLQDVSPHEWHATGRNRILGGDWKK
jgi:putative hydrolases of HD superfamily